MAGQKPDAAGQAAEAGGQKPEAGAPATAVSPGLAASGPRARVPLPAPHLRDSRRVARRTAGRRRGACRRSAADAARRADGRQRQPHRESGRGSLDAARGGTGRPSGRVQHLSFRRRRRAAEHLAVAGIEFEHGGLEFGKEQCYVVRGVQSIQNVSIETEPSAKTCVTPTDTFAPQTPRDLRAVAEPGAINLVWEPNTEADLAGYIVWRGEAPGDTLVPITPQPIRDASYRDTDAKPGVRYIYAVVAVDSATKRNSSAAGASGSDGTMRRFYQIEHKGTPRYVVEDGGAWHLVEGDIFSAWKSGEEVSPRGQRLLPPVEPTKIVAVGRNYKEHAAEMGNPLPVEPMIFLKPPSAVIGPDELIVIPEGVGRVDHEAELGVVIGAARVAASRRKRPAVTSSA